MLMETHVTLAIKLFYLWKNDQSYLSNTPLICSKKIKLNIKCLAKKKGSMNKEVFFFALGFFADKQAKFLLINISVIWFLRFSQENKNGANKK